MAKIPEDDTKKSSGKRWSRKKAKSAGGAEHRDGGKKQPKAHGPFESRREFRAQERLSPRTRGAGETTVTPRVFRRPHRIPSPGAGVLYTIAAGVSRGWQASLVAAFACTLGMFRTCAAVTGLAAIMHASAWRSRSSNGLVSPTCSTWRGRPSATSRCSRSTRSRRAVPWRVIVSGILVNTLNPKLTIFFLAFLPQFVRRRGAVPLHGVSQRGLHGGTLVVFSATGVRRRRCGARLLPAALVAWVRRSFGATYLVLGGKLAAQTR